MESSYDASGTYDTEELVRRQAVDAGGRNYDGSWNLSFGVNNHLVLLTATALFLLYLVASLMLFVMRWRGCLVRTNSVLAKSVLS